MTTPKIPAELKSWHRSWPGLQDYLPQLQDFLQSFRVGSQIYKGLLQTMKDIDEWEQMSTSDQYVDCNVSKFVTTFIRPMCRDMNETQCATFLDQFATYFTCTLVFATWFSQPNNPKMQDDSDCIILTQKPCNKDFWPDLQLVKPACAKRSFAPIGLCDDLAINELFELDLKDVEYFAIENDTPTRTKKHKTNIQRHTREHFCDGLPSLSLCDVSQPASLFVTNTQPDMSSIEELSPLA